MTQTNEQVRADGRQNDCYSSGKRAKKFVEVRILNMYRFLESSKNCNFKDRMGKEGGENKEKEGK